jgi:hypothetical protein
MYSSRRVVEATTTLMAMRDDFMMEGHEQAAAFAEGARAAATARRTAGAVLRKTVRNMLTERQIIRSYLALFLVPTGQDGSKVAPLARFGAYEVRLVEFTKDGGPLLWLELYAHDIHCSLNSFGCDTVDDAVAAADELIAEAHELHLASSPESS